MLNRKWNDTATITIIPQAWKSARPREHYSPQIARRTTPQVFLFPPLSLPESPSLIFQMRRHTHQQL